MNLGIWLYTSKGTKIIWTIDKNSEILVAMTGAPLNSQRIDIEIVKILRRTTAYLLCFLIELILNHNNSTIKALSKYHVKKGLYSDATSTPLEDKLFDTIEYVSIFPWIYSIGIKDNSLIKSSFTRYITIANGIIAIYTYLKFNFPPMNHTGMRIIAE